MTVFTIVSLLIACSGASYTASTAFRNHVAKRVERLRDQKEQAWAYLSEKLAAKNPNSGHAKNCHFFRRVFCVGEFFWTYAHSFQILVFFTLSATITFYMAGSPIAPKTVEEMKDIQPAQWMVTALPWMVVFNIACCAATAASVFLLLCGSDGLSNHQTAIDEDASRELIPNGNGDK